MKILRSLVCALAFAGVSSAQLPAVNSALAPTPRVPFVDSNGKPLAGGMVYFYAAGTTTPQATYADATLMTLNPNPVVLDAAGRAPIYFLPRSYKVVVNTSLGASVWSQDNVFDQAQLVRTALSDPTQGAAMIGFTPYGSAPSRTLADLSNPAYGAGMVEYQLGGSGPVPQSVASYLASRLYVTQFGAKCDSTTDDTAAFLAAIAYAQGSASTSGFLGGEVYLPNAAMLPSVAGKLGGACMISKSLILPAGVKLIGNGTLTGPFLAALPGGTWSTYVDPFVFATHTFMVQVGGIVSAPNDGVGIQHLGIGGNGYVQTTVWAQNMQEGSYIFDVSANGFTQFGFDLFGSGTQNSWVDTVETNPAPGAAGTNGIRWEGGGLVRNRISNVTIQGGGAGAGTQQHSSGILASFNGSINNVHCEFYDTCVDLIAGSITAETINCSSTSTVNTCLNIQAGVAATAMGITNQNVIICDHTLVGTGSCNGGTAIQAISEGSQSEAFHSTNAVINGFYLSLASGVGAHLAKMYVDGVLTTGGPFILGGHNTWTDYGNGSLLTINGSNPKGIIIQSTASAGLGGLAINGGGYAGSPSYGSLCAGCTHDGGTFLASATAASQIVMANGAITISAATGLTGGTGFTPVPVAVFTPTAVQLPQIKSLSGTRYLCVDSSGNVMSSVTACSGT